ncbi:hypothetical protein HN51_030507 [Arachis hypogaea]|nr:Basic form of pathogenesis-related protein [Arachis hypogaea]
MKRLLKISLMVISFVSIIPSCLLSQNFPMDYLVVHNAARAEVGVTPLKWDKKLESHAHEFVNEHIANCRGIMSTPTEFYSGIYGQNLGYSPFRGTIASAVAYWVAQKRQYEHKSNKCIDGNPASCHCYVQIVWGASTYLGCARGECHNNEGTLVTCYYYPSANFPAQRPYSVH